MRVICWYGTDAPENNIPIHLQAPEQEWIFSKQRMKSQTERRINIPIKPEQPEEKQHNRPTQNDPVLSELLQNRHITNHHSEGIHPMDLQLLQTTTIIKSIWQGMKILFLMVGIFAMEINFLSKVKKEN